MKKNRKKSAAPPPNAAPETEPLIEQTKKQPFLKRLLFGEETPDLSELEAGSTTILDILSPTSVDTKSRDYIVVDGIFSCLSLYHRLWLLHDGRRKLAGAVGRSRRRCQRVIPF